MNSLPEQSEASFSHLFQVEMLHSSKPAPKPEPILGDLDRDTTSTGGGTLTVFPRRCTDVITTGVFPDMFPHGHMRATGSVSLGPGALYAPTHERFRRCSCGARRIMAGIGGAESTYWTRRSWSASAQFGLTFKVGRRCSSYLQG